MNKIVNLEDATFSEVLARVAYRLAELSYMRNVPRGMPIDWIWRDVALELETLRGTGALRAFCCGAAAARLSGSTARQWRDAVVSRSRLAASRLSGKSKVSGF